jgi:hypothetical protein
MAHGATSKSSGPLVKPKHGPSSEELGPVGRVTWAIYRFLASLKLAVVCLLTLSGVLAYATSFESEYGAKASQQVIYQSWWFGLLLAFLGANIFCAATIRYPWKKRQIGFVVTHAGLLVVLLASILMKWVCWEGSMRIVENGRSSELIDTEAPALTVRPVDSRTGQADDDRTYVFPFRPGAFAWSPSRTEVLSRRNDPFRLKVSRFLPASIGRYSHEAAPDGEDGDPMIALEMKVTPPNALRPIDVFQDDVQESQKWFVAGRLHRRVREVGGIQAVFQTYLDDDGRLLDDFLNPPKIAGESVRFQYADGSGKTRTYEWALGGVGPHGEPSSDVGKTITLPDSDLQVNYEGPIGLPPVLQSEIRRQTGDEDPHGVKFRIRRGEAPWLTHYGWWSPSMPTYMPSENEPPGSKALVHISYFHPPHFDTGLMGVLEVVAAADGKLYYRYTNRTGVQGTGPVAVGKEVALKGGPNQPVALTFSVTDYLPHGKETFSFVQLKQAKGKAEGVPAIFAEMTVDGEPKSFWVRGPVSFDSPATVFLTSGRQQRAIDFGGRAYQVAYSFESKSLPMALELTNFDVRFDRGTRAPKSYTSKVLLTNERRGVTRRPETITMNEPLVHDGLTFYQQSYQELEDPNTGNPNGEFMSVFHVRFDPVWPLMYFGCFLVIIGAFLQFYMRAGVFTDGGKRESERSARRLTPATSEAVASQVP